MRVWLGEGFLVAPPGWGEYAGVALPAILPAVGLLELREVQLLRET